MYSQCVISVFVAQYITATGHTKVLYILKILLSAITLVFSEPLMTSNRYPAERFGRAQNGPTFDRQNTIFAASKLLDEIASGRLNPNIWDHWGINKHIRQNYFLVHIHFNTEESLSHYDIYHETCRRKESSLIRLSRTLDYCSLRCPCFSMHCL